MHCAAVAATRPCRVARCDIRVRLAAGGCVVFWCAYSRGFSHASARRKMAVTTSSGGIVVQIS